MKLEVVLRPKQGERYRYRSGGFSHEALRKRLIFPAVTDDFQWEETATFNDYATVNAGEFSTPSGGPPTARNERRLDLTVLAADFSPSWMSGDLGILEFHNEIMTVLRCRKPFRMEAGIRPSPGYRELVMNATLRTVRRRLTPGLAGMRYYELSFVEDRQDEQERRGNKAGRKRGVKLPASHRLVTGDTLRSLSRDYYGTPNLWRLIAEANGLRKIGGEDALLGLARFKKSRTIKIPNISKPKVKGQSEQ